MDIDNCPIIDVRVLLANRLNKYKLTSCCVVQVTNIG